MDVYGWDISTAFIGFAQLDSGGRLVASRHLDLTKIEGDLLAKSDVAWEFVSSLSSKRTSDIAAGSHFVEDRLAGFSGGGSNAGTIMRLAAFNHSVSWMIHRLWAQPMGGSVVHIHPSTVKALMKRQGLVIPKGSKKKKELTLQFVRDREPSFKIDLNKNSNPKPYMFDKADAYITALAGILSNR